MNTKSTIIKIDEIRSIYEDYCKKDGKAFDDEWFKEFLKFLETDFYDWVRENLRSYFREKN